VLIRFDPNENISGTTMRQQLDWIKLTKTPEVIKGTSFPIDIELNVPWSVISSYQVYYTTDRTKPYQNPASTSPITVSTPSSPDLTSMFLPMIINSTPTPDKLDALLPYSQSLSWNTSAVAKGTYYLCIQTTANGKSTTFCSDAPIRVK
jgi:hypothetical protein